MNFSKNITKVLQKPETYREIFIITWHDLNRSELVLEYNIENWSRLFLILVSTEHKSISCSNFFPQI